MYIQNKLRKMVVVIELTLRIEMMVDTLFSSMNMKSSSACTSDNPTWRSLDHIVLHTVLHTVLHIGSTAELPYMDPFNQKIACFQDRIVLRHTYDNCIPEWQSEHSKIVYLSNTLNSFLSMLPSPLTSTWGSGKSASWLYLWQGFLFENYSPYRLKINLCLSCWLSTANAPPPKFLFFAWPCFWPFRSSTLSSASSSFLLLCELSEMFPLILMRLTMILRSTCSEASSSMNFLPTIRSQNTSSSNIDGAPIASRSHAYPSQSQSSRFISSSLSLGIPFPRSTQCERGF